VLRDDRSTIVTEKKLCYVQHAVPEFLNTVTDVHKACIFHFLCTTWCASNSCIKVAVEIVIIRPSLFVLSVYQCLTLLVGYSTSSL